MDANEEKKVINDILKSRKVSYSMELINVDGDKYTVQNNFDSKVIYIKKGNDYFLEKELE